MGSCTNHPNIRARRDGLCDECLAAAEVQGRPDPGTPRRRPAGEPAPPKAQAGQDGPGPRPTAPSPCIKIDFSENKEILERIGQMAANQFRSIEGQILFLLDPGHEADD